MSLTIRNINPSSTAHSVFGETVDNALNEIVKKVKEFVTSSFGQGAIGFGLGTMLHVIYTPLTEMAIKALGFTIGTGADPFQAMGFADKLLLTPFVCIVAPIVEEYFFRGSFQDWLKEKFEPFYAKLGFSVDQAKMAARISSVFLQSVVFGLVHFTNALAFGCNPILFLPQVIAATLMGFAFGCAKEFTGKLHMPIGMHAGNNVVAWGNYMYKG